MLSLLIVAADAAAAPLPFDASSMLPDFSTVGSLGFAVWYAWYTTAVSIPKLLDAHRQERAEMQSRFDAVVHELLTEMKEQRAEFAASRTVASKP